MTTNCFSNFRAFWLGLVLLCGSLPLRADQFGLFTYQVVGGATVEITRYPQDAAGPVVIPAEINGKPVTSIGGSAFYGCTGLTSATIPASVTYIAPVAFYGCTGLTSVTIPSSVTSIGEAAFLGCIGLTNIEVPATNPNYSSLDGVLFDKDRTSLIQCPGGKPGSYSIPASVTSIGDNAFSGCTGLTSVTIPSSVTSIDYNAFSRCTGLTSVSIPSSVTSIGRYAFSGCTGLTSITLQEGLTTIEWAAFYGCTGLTSVTLPPSLTSIRGGRQCGDMPCGGAFQNCTGLTSVTIPDSVGIIGEKAFSGCSRLTNITIPSSVTSIGSYAFRECTALTSVTLQQGLAAIEGAAFYGCTGLTSVIIPSSVTSIGWSAFANCTGLTSAVFLGDAPFLEGGVFSDMDPGFTIYYLSSRTGFTSPTWEGYPATMINEGIYPAASWLLTHNLWYDADLHQDPDGDGVDLLMAYALDLDPGINLQGSLPVPVLGPDTLSLSFHATSPGITYRAETSTDLTTWTTTGVTQSAPGADSQGTASVPRDSPHRFLRLVVED